MQLVLKLKRLVKEMGMLDTLFYLIERTLRLVTLSKCKLIRYLIVAQPVAESPILHPKRGIKIKVKEVKLGDLIIKEFPVPLRVIEERYARGARCLAATQDGDFVGYCWFITNEYMEDEVRLRYILPKGVLSVWDFDVYISPKYRMGFAFMRLWDEVFSLFRTENIKYTYSRISAFNPASRASHKRLGARSLFYISCFVVGPVQFTFSRKMPIFGVTVKDQFSDYRL